MRKTFLSISGVLLLAVIVVLFNGISRQLFSRASIDLTEDRLYSLSPGTKNILSKIEDPITLKFYFSKTDSSSAPSFRLYGNWVSDLLKEYVRLGKGNIQLEVYDPRPDSDEEEWAQKYGLLPLGGNAGEKFFLGLVGLNSAGEEASIPTFNIGRQETLEFEITKLIVSITQKTKPVVGILSSLNVQGAPEGQFADPRTAAASRPWFFVSQLQQLAETRFFAADIDTIPDDVKVLLLVHPKNLTQKALFAIDQFVMRGGRLIVALDPFCQSDEPKQDPSNPYAAFAADRSSNLPALLEKWGVEMVDKKVVGDLKYATRVSAGYGQQNKDFVLFLSLRGEDSGDTDAINRTNIVTSGLENVMLAWPGSLQVKKQEGVEYETLLSSSKQAKLFEERDYKFGGGNPDELMRNFYGAQTAHVLAVHVSGKLMSNFPEGDAAKAQQAAQQGMSLAGDHLAQSKDISHVVVISDVDFLSDRYSVSTQNVFGLQNVSLINDNMALLQNLIEDFLGNDDLISLRTRGEFTRPFTKVQDLERQAQQRWLQEEMVLQAKLKGANQRLSELQSGTGSEFGSAAFSQALRDEIKRFKLERDEAQQNLRQVRKNLRVDIERLGNRLFAINTFLIPAILIALSIVFYGYRSKKIRSRKGS